MQRTTKTMLSLIAAVATVGFFAVQAQAAPWAGTAFHSTRSCESCHVPHGATGDNSQVPLWNPTHNTGALTGSYTANTVSTNATLGNPDGASKLCLSCHDGSYSAVKANHKIGATNSMGSLANTHPISFVYDAALVAADTAVTGEPGLVNPADLPKDVLDSQGKLQCTSCHDIHSTAVRGASVELAVEAQMKDVNGQLLYTTAGGAITTVATGNTAYMSLEGDDGYYMRWEWDPSTPASGIGSKALFCQKCHIK